MGMYGCDGVKGNECFEEKRRKLKKWSCEAARNVMEPQ